MSVWNDMRKRSLGGDLKQEDFTVVYPGENMGEEILDPLVSETYEECDYSIFTTGTYPWIHIVVARPLSVFAGTHRVKLVTNDGEEYLLDREYSGSEAYYNLTLAREGDFVLGDHDGKKYTIEELKTLAKKIIDQLINCENDIKNRID